MLSRCFLDCSVGVGVFVTGLSQISSFFSCLMCDVRWMIQRAVDVQQRMYTYCYLHVVHLCTTVYYFYNKGRYVP